MERKVIAAKPAARPVQSAVKPVAVGPGAASALHAMGGGRSAGGILALQRAVGNRAVLQLMAVRGRGPRGSNIANGDLIQAARAVQCARIGAAPEDASHIHQAASSGVSGGGGQLPHLDAIQRSFGEHDVSAVKSHTGGAAAAAARSIGALAYTMGNHVAFSSSPDLHTAAHEAAHVVQQRAGVQLAGGIGQVGDPYERHADAVADAVVQGRSSAALLNQFAVVAPAVQAQVTNDLAAPPSSGAIQMVFIGDQARHHMHVGAGVHQPHYKNGNNNGSRINIGNNQNYRKADMELVIETIKGRAGEAGAQACIDWCKQECRNIIAGAGGRAALRAQGQ